MNSFQYGFFDELQKLAWRMTPSELEARDFDQELLDIHRQNAKREPINRLKAMTVGSSLGGLAGLALLKKAPSNLALPALLAGGAMTYAGSRLGEAAHNWDARQIQKAKREIPRLSQRLKELNTADNR